MIDHDAVLAEKLERCSRIHVEAVGKRRVRVQGTCDCLLSCSRIGRLCLAKADR